MNEDLFFIRQLEMNCREIANPVDAMINVPAIMSRLPPQDGHVRGKLSLLPMMRRYQRSPWRDLSSG